MLRQAGTRCHLLALLVVGTLAAQSTQPADWQQRVLAVSHSHPGDVNRARGKPLTACRLPNVAACLMSLLHAETDVVPWASQNVRRLDHEVDEVDWNKTPRRLLQVARQGAASGDLLWTPKSRSPEQATLASQPRVLGMDSAAEVSGLSGRRQGTDRSRLAGNAQQRAGSGAPVRRRPSNPHWFGTLFANPIPKEDRITYIHTQSVRPRWCHCGSHMDNMHILMGCTIDLQNETPAFSRSFGASFARCGITSSTWSLPRTGNSTSSLARLRRRQAAQRLTTSSS